MPLDRARITYLIDDLKSRPDRFRLVQRIVAGLAVSLVLPVVYLLSRGSPRRAPGQERQNRRPGGLRAFAMPLRSPGPSSRSWTATLCLRVHFVPGAATPSQRLGKIVVMGELTNEGDLFALQRELAAMSVSIPVEWHVLVPAGPN